MTNKINNGGPAFGQVVELRCVRVDMNGAEEWEPALAESGMTIRDYFAAKAMPACYAEYCAQANAQGYVEDWKMGVALDAYAMADAMLKAREVSQ